MQVPNPQSWFGIQLWIPDGPLKGFASWVQTFPLQLFRETTCQVSWRPLIAVMSCPMPEQPREQGTSRDVCGRLATVHFLKYMESLLFGDKWQNVTV